MIFTAGHSSLSALDLATLLRAALVTEVWDVRSYPSSHWSWFARAEMERWLPEAGIGYRWVPDLGGRRQAPQAPPAQPAPGGWSEPGFWNYQWYMQTAEFAAAASELLAAGARRDLAVMCSEGVWWRCHRAMIADYLVFGGSDAVHLQPQRARHSAVIGDRLARYEPAVLAAWRRQPASPAAAARPTLP
jgi:uncharacterized protein (DUF488 family)